MADRNKLRTRCQGVRESLCIILIKNFFEGQKGEGRKRKITWRDERLVLLVRKKEKKNGAQTGWSATRGKEREDCIKEARKKNIRERVSSRQDRALASH